MQLSSAALSVFFWFPIDFVPVCGFSLSPFLRRFHQTGSQFQLQLQLQWQWQLRLQQSLEVVASSKTTHEASILEGCNVNAPSSVCATAILSYLDALSLGTVQPTFTPAGTIASYFDALSSNGPPSNTAVSTYIDLLSSGIIAPPTPQALTSYMDAISDELITTPSSAAAISSFLDSYIFLPNIDRECNVLENVSSPTGMEECATAITSYLNVPSTGAAVKLEADAAPAEALTSHLDSMTAMPVGGKDDQLPPSFGPAVKSYIDSISSGVEAPPSGLAITSYLDAFSSGKVASPSTGTEIVSYLDSTSVPAGFIGDISVPVVTCVRPYLDTVTEQCNGGVPSGECAEAITDYLGALSTGQIKPEASPAVAISSYLDSIGRLATSVTQSSGAGIASYLDSISTGEVAAPSKQEVGLYLDAVSSGNLALPFFASYDYYISSSPSPLPFYLKDINDAGKADGPSGECEGTIVGHLGAVYDVPISEVSTTTHTPASKDRTKATEQENSCAIEIQKETDTLPVGASTISPHKSLPISDLNTLFSIQGESPAASPPPPSYFDAPPLFSQTRAFVSDQAAPSSLPGAQEQAPSINDGSAMSSPTRFEGAGPTGAANMYMLMDTMIDTGIEIGLSRETATTLVQKTLLESIKNARESGKYPTMLRNTIPTLGDPNTSAV